MAEYTYLRLTASDGAEHWAAVSKSPVAIGASVVIADAARMTDFHSASLKRTFPIIYFGNLAGGRSQQTARTLPPGHPTIGADGMPAHGTTSAPTQANVVAPASGPNARTIAALLGERASLAGAPVRVQGRVVKVTPVQGVNYIRLRDGSSTDAELVVSSRDVAQVSEVVTFEGKVGLDVDVGIGTTYPVMLQEAKRSP